jgi:hypothetical protein
VAGYGTQVRTVFRNSLFVIGIGIVATNGPMLTDSYDGDVARLWFGASAMMLAGAWLLMKGEPTC